VRLGGRLHLSWVGLVQGQEDFNTRVSPHAIPFLTRCRGYLYGVSLLSVQSLGDND
jgi:hypothetical protein